MATIDSTAPDAAQSAPPPPDPHDELIDALYRLQGAISRVRVTAAARVARLDPAQHEQADELVMEELDEAYDAMDRAILHVEGPHRAPAAEAEETHQEPQASTDSTSGPDAPPSPVPLSEKLRQVAIELGNCHSAIALTARALGASTTVDEQSEAAGWAADELERVEAELEELDSTMAMKWIEVRRLEEKAAAKEAQS